MNAIKITLDKNASGKVAELYKDFAMYVNSYQNKLVDVYVPKEMLYTNPQSLNIDETPTQFANSVKIGGLLTADNGSKITTDSYYMDFLKETTINDVDYVVFERIMPKELTAYAGNQQIVINVLLVDSSVTPVKVLQVVTTQICNLLVQNSDYIGDETVVDPTKTEEFDARITQNKTDIVDLQTRMTTTESNVEQNTEDIAQNTNDIAAMKQVIGTGEEYIGTLEWTSATLPTNEELNAYVYEKRQRVPKNGDVVIVIQKLAEQTDKNFKYIYAVSDWTHYEIPPMELAGNGTAGIVSGTYGIGKTNDTLVDIAGGEILNIYIKDTTGQYRNLVEYLNASNISIANIISGTTQVGNALKAVNDNVGNNIFETYLTKEFGVTKSELRDYAMPREFNDVDFIGLQGYQDNIPTTPESGIQFTTTTTSVGDTQLFEIEKTNTADFELSAKNGYSNTIYVSADKDCQVKFRLTTQYKKASGDWQNLNIELSSSISLIAGNIEKLTFASPFTYLEENVISLTNGDKIRQILEVVTTTLETIVFDVYSNQTYPSIFYLTSQSYTLSEMTENIGKELTLGADGVVENNKVVFTVKDAESFIEYRTSYRKFLMNLHLPVSGEVDLTFPVAITFGDTTFNVYNLMKGSVTPITFGDLQSTKNYSNKSGYFFNLEMLFLQTEDFVGFFIIPPAVNAKQIDNIINDTDTVVTDLDASGTKLVIHLSAEVVDKLAKVLVVPASAPAETGLVAISPQNVQQLIELGNGLSLVNGHIDVVLNSNVAPFVDYSKAQSLTDAQKAQARVNIGAVATSDIVDNLTTEDATKVLSANQGKVLSEQNSALTTELNKKQDTLISGTNIKTLNNESLLGEGNIDITSAQWGNITGDLNNQTDLKNALNEKANNSNVESLTTQVNANTTNISTNTESITNLQTSKLDASKANVDVMTDLGVTAQNDNVSLNKNYKNLSTQETSSYSVNVPLANDTTAGLMSKADYAQLRDNTARIEQLEGQNIRLLYTASDNPTASQIEAFVKSEGYTDTTQWSQICVVVSGTNHIWRYYTNTTTWTDIGVDTVNQFTNSIAGIIKGSATNGKVYAETDGTGSVYGWDDLNTKVTNNTNAIGTETTNRTSADETLQNNIDTVSSNLSNEISNRKSADTNLQTQITTNTTNISNKMDKTNPTGTGSFSLNRANGTTIGNYSFAEGHSTTSSGYASHSEGDTSMASGDASHAEGENTNASGGSSHSEGEGTIASGQKSHVEGFHTIAAGENQHVFGKYNVKDTENKYVEIVGNGRESADDSKRSNARTLDWNGNEYIKGNLQTAGLTDGTTTQKMTTIVGLPTRVDTINTNLTNEITNRQNADTALQENIDTEVTNRQNADTTLQESINGKLAASNIKAGTNIRISTSGNDVTINAETGEGGTIVYVNDVKQESISFDSNPQTQITNKMDKINPVGSGSFSMNRKSGTTVGASSSTLGSNCTASHKNAHAEGLNTTASGFNSHAEGQASKATSSESHAEGLGTIASGVRSHAEGHSTKASGEDQHVFGRYNIEDTENKYVEIVGNGDVLHPSGSNARTLDWNGNEYLAGNLQASGLTDGTTTKTMSEILAGGGMKLWRYED